MELSDLTEEDFQMLTDNEKSIYDKCGIDF